ncbi:hypothetical protein EDB89DRAFT_2125825 [Lactarius sanguifluus]|nr:hypothetical protein EDB89DRAFT_2125825 [Lactarius sanguifluus]
MSFNATVGSPHQLTASQLYAGSNVDYTQINWFEKQWMAWYLWIGNPVIATGLAALLLHETVYFGRCIPWIIIDAIPFFRKWKLQPGKLPTPQEQWECTKGVLFSHFTVEAPAIFLFHPIAESCGMKTWQVPFPAWQTMLPQLAFFFFFEDMFHYFSHQLLHTPLLYKHIHKLHHKYSAPFVMILGTGTILGPLLYCKLTQNVHILTVYIWITLRLFQAIDAHSGYDFPWSLQHIVPFWSGAEHHDFHHMAFVNNFSTSFRWWDRVLGTDGKYRAYRERIRAATKGLDEAHRKAVEEKLVAEEEEAGFAAEQEVERQAEGKKNQ